MILLDSSILIELFRKKNKDKTTFFKLSSSFTDFSISTITYYEIGIGNREAHFSFWNKLSNQLNIIPFDTDCSSKAIEIYLELLKSNKLIDLADIFIAATALSLDIPIATLNKKHFERIKELEIIS